MWDTATVNESDDHEGAAWHEADPVIDGLRVDSPDYPMDR
jgi:hypothetical protein